VDGFVQRAREAGPTIACGGERPSVPGFEGGAFYRPTLITDAAQDT